MGLRSRGCLFGLALVAALSFAEEPRIALPESELIPVCLTASNAASGYFAGAAKWTLSCSHESLIDRFKTTNPVSPALRLLYARELHEEALKIRGETFKEFFDRPEELNRLEARLFDVFHDLFPTTLVPQTPVVPVATAEGSVLSRTQAIIEVQEAILKPLFGPHSVLSAEASIERLTTLGDSLRFSAAADHLNEHWPLIGPQTIQREAIQQIMNWMDVYGAAPLRPWLLEKVNTLRSSEITGAKPEQLSYWIKSLELAGTPADKAAKEDALARLRELWIAYPKSSDARRIRTLAERIGISSDFVPPGNKDLHFDELLTHAHAQVRAVDGTGALRTLSRVLNLAKSDGLTTDQLWQALQLHVRVLRINDQRDLIPGVLNSYIRVGKLFDPPLDGEEFEKFLARGVELTRFFWSYDDPDKAEAVLNRYLKSARIPGPVTEPSVGSFLYLKARMAEQGKNPLKTKQVFAEALAAKQSTDMYADLVWRNLLLHFDLARDSKTPEEDIDALLALFDPMKRILQDPTDRARWHYWRGKAWLLAQDKTKATESFEKAYAEESMSFYSNLSGLELAALEKKPTDWVVGSERNYTKPDWSVFFSVAGEPRLPVYKDLTRVYLLASIGDFEGALQASREMDSALWDRILSARSPIKDKRHYVRALAWLRMAIQDPMGSLKVAEIARQSYGPQFESEDYLYLYPLPYWDGIQQEATQRGVNPWLAASLIRQESAFDSKAKSGANALGLMQMIPAVANAEAKALGLEDFEIQNLYEPSTAIKLGVYHLGKRIEEMEGSWICATAAYNAGTPPVFKWLANYDSQIPVAFIERISFTETRNYVRAILRNYMNYRRIYGDGVFGIDEIVRMPKKLVTTLSTKKTKSRRRL